MIIIFILTTFLLVEGTGTIISRESINYLYLFLPTLFFFYLKIKKKSIFFPKHLSIIYGLFLFFSLISTVFFSVDKQISFELVSFYFAAFLIFIFFYNNKELAKKYIRIAVFAGSILFTIVYLFKLNINPVDSYQLVMPYYNNIHNHLGDFLGLGLVVFAYSLILKKENNWFLAFILFLPFFLFSFSRSAYFALLVTLLFLLIKNKSIRLFSLKTTVILILLVLSMVFFFVIVKEVNNKTIVGKVNQLLSSKFNLQGKEFAAGRLIYLKQGINSFIDHPLFGVGPGNFIYASKKYASPQTQWYDFSSTDTAHSLPLDILSENGGLAFIFFGLFILLILINIFKKNNLENYLLFYLLVNFQTDYTYRIYSLFILFMILAAAIYEEKKTKTNQLNIYTLLGMASLIIFTAIFTTQILLKFSYLLPSIIYPLNKDAYKTMINEKVQQGNCQLAKKDALKLYSVSSGYLPTLEFLSQFYNTCGDKKNAIKMLDEASSNNKFISFDIVKKNYLLKKEVYGEKVASLFLRGILRGYDLLKYNNTFKKQIADFCLKNGERACLEQDFGGWRYFYEPDPKKQEKVLKQIPYPEDYTINKDTLNERFDYSREKLADVFRIVVLGDSMTFGLLVETKDNWTEKMEDLLNQHIVDPKIKKIEVINLGVHGYDIPYEVERFRRRGPKYKPDLVLWFVSNGNFYQFNEAMFEKTGRIEEEMKKTGELEKELANDNYYPAWEKAYKETEKEIGKTGFLSIVKSYLDSFRQNYSGQLVIVGPPLENKIKKVLTEALGEKKVNFNPINSLDNQQYYFSLYGQVNELGHQMIADEVFRFITENKLIKL